ARGIAADLMNERIKQFEHIVSNDLPALFDELNLDEPVRGALTWHADNLKDWTSGILEWHRRCARYTEAELRRTYGSGSPRPDFSFLPTGLGTSAARLAGAQTGGAQPRVPLE